LNINKINAQRSSTQFPNRGTENSKLIRTCTFLDSRQSLKPSVSFFDNGMFQFFFSPFSSYIGVGHYTIKNNKVTLNTDDGKFTYVFHVAEKDESDPKTSTVEGGTNLVFDAEISSDMLWQSDITHGSIFY